MGRVYGGYRSWSSGYRVTLDNKAEGSYQGYTGGPDMFDQVLYAVWDLPAARHQIRFTNNGQDPAHPILDFERVSLVTRQRSQ